MAPKGQPLISGQLRATERSARCVCALFLRALCPPLSKTGGSCRGIIPDYKGRFGGGRRFLGWLRKPNRTSQVCPPSWKIPCFTEKGAVHQAGRKTRIWAMGVSLRFRDTRFGGWLSGKPHLKHPCSGSLILRRSVVLGLPIAWESTSSSPNLGVAYMKTSLCGLVATLSDNVLCFSCLVEHTGTGTINKQMRYLYVSCVCQRQQQRNIAMSFIWGASKVVGGHNPHLNDL